MHLNFKDKCFLNHDLELEKKKPMIKLTIKHIFLIILYFFIHIHVEANAMDNKAQVITNLKLLKQELQDVNYKFTEKELAIFKKIEDKIARQIPIEIKFKY